MRLFRQRELGNWDEVFQRMKEELRNMRPAPAPAPTISVEVGPGELLDKITILEIKSERLTDEGKLANVRVELATLASARDQALPASPDLTRLAAELKAVNEKLWQIEDEIRDCERRQDFGPKFTELARSVYHQNDRRAALKRQINDLLGARIVEEKSYTDYSAPAVCQMATESGRQ
jgi:hypothetical protein